MDSPKLKPCPHCVGTNLRVYWNDIYGKHYVRCHTCHMQGAEIYGRDKAAEAWNSIPRAITWTKETPMQPGWYWIKEPGKGVEIIRVEKYFGLEDKFIAFFLETESSKFLHELSQGTMYAGPIPDPKEVG